MRHRGIIADASGLEIPNCQPPGSTHSVKSTRPELTVGLRYHRCASVEAPVAQNDEGSCPRRRTIQGGSMNRVVKIVAAVAVFALLPTLAFAQATIAGVVRDASTAVLPGVSV